MMTPMNPSLTIHGSDKLVDIFFALKTAAEVAEEAGAPGAIKHYRLAAEFASAAGYGNAAVACRDKADELWMKIAAKTLFKKEEA